MTLGHKYVAMTGLQGESCHWLAHRFDEAVGFRPDQGESWVGYSKGDRLTSSLGQQGWMTGIYQTNTKVWVSESAGRIYMNPKLGLEAPWQTFQLEGVLRGVWGVEDDCVFTWGLHRGDPVVYNWDGKEWRSVENSGHIVGMHGASRDLVVAVGLKGHVAMWNGSSTFESMASAAKGTLSDVYVVSPDEIYACGPDGELVQGTVHGWEMALEPEVPLHCVAGWNGEIWVGALDGLHRFEDGALTCAKDNFAPIRFDAREELLIACENALVNTADGANFRGYPISTFTKVTSGKRPSWR